MKNFNIFLIFLTLISSSIYSKVDPLNTYRWNRKNVMNYSGKVKRSDWFEWWYFKIVLPETKDAFFFVYGVVNPWDTNQLQKSSRSYVEVGDFQSKEQIQGHFNVEDFQASYEKTYIKIQDNIATDKELKGSLQKENGAFVKWDISINNRWTFNSEGWATGKNFTNIEWYPAQTDARCSGYIENEGRIYNFTNTPCYQDRNWGKSFPKWWTWIVSNHFNDSPGTALAIGGGRPKYFNIDLAFGTAVIGFKHKGKIYEFRPHYFDKVKIDINFGNWEVVASNREYKLEVTAHAPRDSFMDLQFMTPSGEVFHDYETLTGSLKVKLYKKSRRFFFRWELIETLHSDVAGIEYGSFDTYQFEKNFTEKNHFDFF